MTSDSTPRKSRKWPLVLGGLLGFVVLVGACNASGDSSTDAAAPVAAPAASAAPEPPAPEVPSVLAVGDTADVEGLLLTVNSIQDGDDVLGPTSCITVSYENTSPDEEASFNTFDWELRDTEGVEVTSGFTGSDDILGSGNLRPGGRKSGDVCFDSQGSGTPESVVYTGSLFGGREDLLWAVS